MTQNRISLRKYIRFQLEQMSASNEHHRFEDLAYELSRLRIASNVVRSTGPVQAGGDQGRDFETFRTYLGRSAIGSSSFVARASNETIAFACTLNKAIESKVKSDLAAIFGGGDRPDAVTYLCVPDIPVAMRHKLLDHCRDQYGAKLTLLDGQTISDMLSDPDTFWIAEEFLSVPAELFPPVVVDEEYQKLKEKWLTEPLDGGPSNLAEFLEIKRGMRRATFEENARPDLDGWIRRMEPLKAIPGLRRKVVYEIAVATLRGKGFLDAKDAALAEYFSTLPIEAPLEDIEDIVYLASYTSSARAHGHLSRANHEVEGWIDEAAKAVDRGLQLHTAQSSQFRLLSLRGHVEILAFWHQGATEAAGKAISTWNLAADIAKEDPLSDASTLADIIMIIAPALGSRGDFQDLTDKIDMLVSEREGKVAAGDLARGRAVAFAESGQLLLAIDQLQRAKENWFSAETLKGSVLAMLLLSQWYAELHLPHAARYHASMALYTIVRADDDGLGEMSVRSGFALAATFFLAGEMLSYLSCVGHVLPMHSSYRVDPDDAELHDDFARAIAQGAVILATASVVAPEIVQRARSIVVGWNVDEAYKDAMDTATKSPPWFGMSHDEVITKLRAEIGQDIVNDVLGEVRITWKALGLNWTILAPRRLRRRAEALAATLQIVLADLASTDLVVIPSAVELRLQLGSAQWDTRHEPNNDKLSWILSLPTDDDKSNDPKVLDREARSSLAFVMQTLRQVSALPNEMLMKAFEARMERGLWKKVGFVRPPGHLMEEARAMADHERDAGPLTVAEPRPSIEPLEHQLMVGPQGDAVLYSKTKAMEMIANRYAKLGPYAARVMPGLMRDPKIRAMLQAEHDRGIRDWELITIILNIALNQSVRADPARVRVDGMDAYRSQLAAESQVLLSGGGPPFDPAWLKSEDWPMHVRTFIMAVTNSWGLVSNRQTPNIDAFRTLLERRFHHLDDDLPHDNWFGWFSPAQADREP
ncbi:hypothetical protein SAMN02745157_1623 [Kaistia soli DSM 19436]|uniref:Uncharacterized protein n=1 Tax=Kaistia soli DSM 19436 TaxID=1122133 RepID=A0A1M4YVB5_9HYPH|nr:hypothetical protein [Kaistia soli]SHF09432.1 hypothetical protein SAMN02745157_1623 [Kaistia soli DSM 19436]